MKLKIGPTGCPETSVQNNHSMLRNTPKNSTDRIYIAAEA
jgi:hypothetical protein